PVKAKLKEQVLVTALLQASYLGSTSANSMNLRKNRPPRRFFRFRSDNTSEQVKRQEQHIARHQSKG
ncbi:TPA: hypothetical protein ACXEXX_005357, partial [Klebsiella pneumoniae]